MSRRWRAVDEETVPTQTTASQARSSRATGATYVASTSRVDGVGGVPTPSRKHAPAAWRLHLHAVPIIMLVLRRAGLLHALLLVRRQTMTVDQ